MIEGATLSGFAKQGESTAVEQLWEDVGQLHILDIDARAVGQALHLLEVPLVDKLPGPL